ncbi:synaptotagmin-2 [Alosa pseudoharengus]|uniref:synaptotagmin-2 n=1 Tax=Alosa pseudoharengus TaxID=34774 RepID=UPI003F8914AE
MILLPGTQQLDIRMPFPDEIKYTILGISILLFLIAMGILIWQVHKCCSKAHYSKDSVSSLVGADELDQSRSSYLDSQRPRFKEEFAHDQVHRLSRCLSQDSLPASMLSGSLESLEDQESEDEPQMRGSLRFSLYYDQLQGRLVVTVLEARQLPLREFSHSVDPFVRVRLLWANEANEEGDTEEEEEEVEERRTTARKEKSSVSVRPQQCVLHEWQSRLVKNSSSPAFGDQFSCSLAEEEVHRVTVKLEVRDFDKYSRHGILGEVRRPLSNLNISYPLEMWQDLQRPTKDLVGEVLLSLKYMPTSQRVEVGILKIRIISKSSRTDRALYVRTSVQCNQCKLRHQKTAPKTRWDVTVFNEVMIFVLPDPPVRDCTIVVSVYELNPGKKSSKHLIGQLTIGKGRQSEDEHWKLMMRSLRQPIAKWHLLYV